MCFKMLLFEHEKEEKNYSSFCKISSFTKHQQVLYIYPLSHSLRVKTFTEMNNDDDTFPWTEYRKYYRICNWFQ